MRFRLPHPVFALGLFGALAVAATPGVLKLRIDNSPERFFVRDDESLRRQAVFQELFGGGRKLIVVLRARDLWTAAGLEAVAEVERVAGRAPAVVRAGGLWSRYRWLEPAWPPEDLKAFKRRARGDPLARAAGWVGRSNRTLTILVELEKDAGPEAVSALEAELRRAAPEEISIELAGLPVVERAMDRGIRRLLTVHFPALMAAVILLLWIGFRTAAETAAPIVFVAAVELTALGALGHAGATIDLVSAVFLPLLFVISLATAVHLQAGLRRELESGLGPREACAATLRRKGAAVLWTGLTTAVAFSSFAVSPLPPIRSLGLWLAGALLWMLIAAFGLYPALMTRTARAAAERSRRSLERAVRLSSGRLVRWVAHRRAPLLCVFTALAVVALAGVFSLGLESGLLSYLAPDDPARRAALALQAEGLGSGVAELMIQLPEGSALEDRFRDPDGLERLARLASTLRALPEVRGAIGAGDLFEAAVADIVVSGEPGRSARWLVLGLMQADPGAASTLDAFLADEGRAARISLLLPLQGPQELDPVLASAEAASRAAFPEAAVSVVGELPLILATQRRLLETLAGSFALTLAVIVLIFAALTRSLPDLLRYLAPNLWAVLAVFGAMGWAGVPLDSTTVMIGAVALGLAVDDTLHTMAEMRADGKTPGSRGLPVILSRVASAHTLTSLVLVAGFAVVAFSDLVPIARFGALAVVGVIAALAGDLFLLPALLMGRSSRDAVPGPRDSRPA